MARQRDRDRGVLVRYRGSTTANAKPVFGVRLGSKAASTSPDIMQPYHRLPRLQAALRPRPSLLGIKRSTQESRTSTHQYRSEAPCLTELAAPLSLADREHPMPEERHVVGVGDRIER